MFKKGQMKKTMIGALSPTLNTQTTLYSGKEALVAVAGAKFAIEPFLSLVLLVQQ